MRPEFDPRDRQWLYVRGYGWSPTRTRGFSPVSSHRNDPLVQNIRALYRTPLEISFRAFMGYPG
jgi:hypothetical protein